MKRIEASVVRRFARGRWRYILSAAGISEQFLNGKHGPCPFCGGRDRWRFDDKDGNGTGFCNRCDATGDGFRLAAKALGLDQKRDFGSVLEFVARQIDRPGSFAGFDDVRNKRRDLIKTRIAERIWNESSPLSFQNSAPVSRYLSKRGLSLPIDVKTLRTHNAVEYRDNLDRVQKFPAMVGRICDVDGQFLGIHRTFLSNSGEKALVEKPKMLLGATRQGSVQLDPASDILHVAEGIETALAVREALGVPMWAAISAGNLEVLELPKGLARLHIWADLDANGQGEHSAQVLAKRAHVLKIRVFIHLPEMKLPPETKSVDWLDVFNQRSSVFGSKNAEE